jgi:hypothetical protein
MLESHLVRWLSASVRHISNLMEEVSIMEYDQDKIDEYTLTLQGDLGTGHANRL